MIQLDFYIKEAGEVWGTFEGVCLQLKYYTHHIPSPIWPPSSP